MGRFPFLLGDETFRLADIGTLEIVVCPDILNIAPPPPEEALRGEICSIFSSIHRKINFLLVNIS